MNRILRMAMAIVVALTVATSPVVAVYSDGQIACYDGTNAAGVWDDSLVFFDGELPGCVDGIPVRVGVPNIDGELVTGPWLRWVATE